MPCYNPLVGYQPLEGGQLKFGKEPKNARSVTIPCGQCRGCRLEKSRQDALKCVHEAQMHEDNCFITLTYDDKYLPEHGSLHKPDLQKFFKRVRKNLDVKFKYYACGEYGDETQRAHYHACMFGVDFKDKIAFKKIGEHQLYISAQLNQLWGLGNTSIGNLTFETAAYTARYVMKKQTGLAKGGKGYVRLDEETGEVIPLVQPFALMSQSLAAAWLRSYHADIYGADKDYIVIRGKRMRPPKSYDRMYTDINADHMAWIKGERRKKSEGLTNEELRAREKVAHARTYTKTQI